MANETTKVDAISIGRGNAAGGTNLNLTCCPSVSLLLSVLGREEAQGEASI